MAHALTPTQTATLRAVYDAGGTVDYTFRAAGANVRSLAALAKAGMLARGEAHYVDGMLRQSLSITDAGLDALFGSVKVE